MEFRVLGPLEIRADDGRTLTPARRKQRVLLAMLLLHANRPVSVTTILDNLWPGSAPRSARSNLYSYVSDLRRLLHTPHRPGPARIEGRPQAYVVRTEAGEVDAATFERLAIDGYRALAAGAYADAEDLVGRALALWRDGVLSDLDLPDAARAEATRLEELRLAAVEHRLDARLRLGRHEAVGAEAQTLTAAYPHRERLWGQLMLALYRSGRQTEALEAYRRAFRVLGAELGVEPGPELADLHRRILNQDPGLLPTVRPAPAPPRQLPPRTPMFVGRKSQLRALDEVLADSGDPDRSTLAVIAGGPGTGKTALAVHWANRVADRFPDGQLFVNVHGYTAGTAPLRAIDVLARLLRALGVPAEQVPADLDAATDLYRSRLAGSRTLVVLDNVSHAHQVRPLLPGSATCLVLVTSRHRLTGLVARDGARRVTVGALPLDEAVGLLGELLDPERYHREPDAVREVARQCGQLPLALRIAAAKLADEPYTTVAAYGSLLAARRLAALEVDDDPQAAVRVAFDLSYAGLPPGARRLFRLAGLAPGPDLALDAAAALAGVDDVAADLAVLLAGHLVEQEEPGRFAMHDLLRAYAVEVAHREDGADDRRAALARLSRHYLSHVDAAARQVYPTAVRLPLGNGGRLPFSDRADALGWLDAERRNLVALALHGPSETTWQLADALRTYFYLRPDPVDWLALATAGVAAAEADGPPQAQAAAYLSLALMRGRQGRFDAATGHFHRALDLAGKAGWADGETAAHNFLGLIAANTGRLALAAEHYQHSYTAHRRAHGPGGNPAALTNLGSLYLELGELRRGMRILTRVLAVDRASGDSLGLAVVLTEVGEGHRLLGNLAAAVRYLDRGVAQHRANGNRVNEVEALCRLASAHLDSGRPDRARRVAESAVRLVHEVGHRRLEGMALRTLADVHAEQGRLPAAEESYRLALTAATDTANRGLRAEILVGLAGCAAAVGPVSGDAPCRAYDLAAEAVDLAHEAGYAVLEGVALTRVAQARLAMGEPQEALASAERAVAGHRATGHRIGQARALVVLGRIWDRVGVPAEAKSAWDEAAALFHACGAPAP